MVSAISFLSFMFMASLSGGVLAQATDHCTEAADVSGDSLVVNINLQQGSLQLDGVVQCVKRLAFSNPSITHVKLQIDPGTYYITGALTFSGTWVENKTIEIQGSGEETVISGALPIKNTLRLVGQRNGVGLYAATVPPTLVDAMGQQWLPEHGQRNHLAPPELIVDGVIQRLARWPDEGFISTQRVGSSIVFEKPESFPGVIGSFARAHGYWYHDWADARVELELNALERGVITFRSKQPKYGLREGARFYLYGDPKFLSAAGEYVADPSTDSVAFLAGFTPNSVEVTNATNLLVIRNAAAAKVTDITFEASRGNAIDIVGNNNLIENCEIRNVGAVGVRMLGSNNRISRSRVSFSGYSGVEIYGGDRLTLQAANSSITESTVENFGRLIGSSVPGIRIEGVGISIVKNLIRHGPHAGVFYFGNDHFIADNEIHDVAKTTGDVGAIYTGRDWSGRGHKILRNYIHDVIGVGRHGATAIYLDDQASGIHVSENIAWRVRRGILLGGGRDNVVTRNLVFAEDESIQFDARGLTWQAQSSAKGGELWKRLQAIPYEDTVYRQKYPSLAAQATFNPGQPMGNFVRDNVFIGRLAVDPLVQKYNPLGHNWTQGNPGLPNEVYQREGEAPSRNAFQIDWSKVTSGSNGLNIQILR